ncbi:recQ-mediated genome instability protein 2 isoform X2 [Leucoraja erinacea]|uniref:recQ-mediated genome instability protein 2 isoform X2 n=1 Tax=Leucoraja erinaceus TaxID=7782 RepID=UPI002453DF11|nr:recQ-mediated genome instability protein 2 isoform X2 [Leucoraja erinacea]
MAGGGGCRLQSPPSKVLSEQLRAAATRTGLPAAWLLHRAGDSDGGRAPLDVSVVWMQGTVLDVRPEHNTSLQLLDETGTFTVVGAGGVPHGRPCTNRGPVPSIYRWIPDPPLGETRGRMVPGRAEHRTPQPLQLLHQWNRAHQSN